MKTNAVRAPIPPDERLARSREGFQQKVKVRHR